MTSYSTPEDITVGVIGYGGAFNMGKRHLSEMQRAGMKPIAVAELDPERLAVAKTDFPGIETYSSVDDMLARSAVSLVTIITPHNTHAALALQCLNAGKHVVCEKPLAITTAECDAMIAAADRGQLLLSTYHNRHWDGWILNAVKMIRQDRVIGDIVRIEAHMGGCGKPRDWWRSSKSVSGGILYDWGVHLLEYALQLIDADMVEVSGYAKKGFWAPQTPYKDDANEDEGFAVVRFATGQWLTLCITSIDANAIRGMLEITGTEGTFIFDTAGWEIIKRDGDQTIIRKGQNPKEEGWRFYQNIADHLVKREALVITAEWARRPIHVLDLACQSAARGTAIPTTYR